MITISAAVVFIRIIACLVIISIDAHWLISIIAYAEQIPEDCSVCGIGLKNNGERAPGGSSPENAISYPWMVSVGWHSANHHCLGAMIDSYHILTAAHCLIDEDGEELDYNKVYFRNEPQNDTDNGIDIEKIIVHPLYGLIDSESTGILIAKYDIALLKLEQKIKCDKYKYPICLPPAGFKFRLGAKNIFSLWDFPDQVRRNSTARLRHGYIKNLKISECIKGVPETRSVKNHTLCQGGTQHRMCYGDSGSPLMSKINERYYIVGIASSETNKDCTLNKPMIFMDIIKFLDWVENETNTTHLSLSAAAPIVSNNAEADQSFLHVLLIFLSYIIISSLNSMT